ncbi:A24 family peptidase [Marinomonas sp. S3726]|uniref:prepilin peptidase n=1 Tax=Marinomonas sp. S3726 TaxID=579484 RepID=UPI000A01ABEB|nr:A24 family peptidase [Marinomonas sp. S3726]
MTAYISRTPKYEEFIWRKEAHEFLNLTFNDSPPPSFHSGRSLCPKCQHTLKFYDLIPILSFLSTRGKCRYCKSTIAITYPLTELASLLICLPLLYISSSWLSLLILTCLFCLLICISVIDWKVQWIPDQLNLLLLGIALIYNMMENAIPMKEAVFGMMLGYLCIVSIRQLYLIFKKIEAIGLGDAKLLAALGAWQGVESLFYILFYASIAGVMYAILSRKGRYQSLAFGPFLCFAALLNFFITNQY